MAERAPEPETPEATSNDFESSLSTDDLSVLLELFEDGLPVNWPRGLDARIAKIILARRKGDT